MPPNERLCVRREVLGRDNGGIVCSDGEVSIGEGSWWRDGGMGFEGIGEGRVG